jgi:hypothetical protein
MLKHCYERRIVVLISLYQMLHSLSTTPENEWCDITRRVRGNTFHCTGQLPCSNYRRNSETTFSVPHPRRENAWAISSYKGVFCFKFTVHCHCSDLSPATKPQLLWGWAKKHGSLLGKVLLLSWSTYAPKHKLHSLSPRANYTDRETAACRRSDWKLVRIEGATWSAWRIHTAVF